MPSSDPDFIRYCANGDEPAFRALVARHLSMVLGVATRKLGPHGHLAQDVAQAVFTRLARAARGLPRQLIVATWLHRQTVRLAIDAVRREERRRRRETTAAMLHAPDSTPPAEIAPLLDEALDALPAADRSVLVLHYLEERDYESVARALGTTPEAARKRASRSLEKLRALLSRHRVPLSAAALAGILSDQPAIAASPALTARISAGAVKAAATGKTAAVLTAAITANAAAIAIGALTALLVCSGLYWQREKQIAKHAVATQPGAATVRNGRPGSIAGAAARTSPEAPATLPEIIAALVEITNGPNSRIAQKRIDALLHGVAPEEYLEFYVKAESQVHPLRWLAVVRASVDEWQKRDPASLTRALVESDRRKEFEMVRLKYTGQADLNLYSCSRSSVEAARLECFSGWLKVEPNEALAWLRSERDAQPVSHVFGYLADAAVRIAGINPFQEWPGTVAGTENYCRRQCVTNGGIVRALQDASSPAERKALVQQAGLDDIADAKRAIQTAPEHERFDLSLALLPTDIWLRPGNAPEPSAEVQFQKMNETLGMAGELPRTEAVTRLVVSRLSPGDGHGAEELMTWVRSLPDIETSEVLQAGARTLADQKYKARIALNWAAAIPNAEQRGPLLRGVFLRWHDADPGAAQKFLTTAPPELTAQLQPVASETP